MLISWSFAAILVADFETPGYCVKLYLLTVLDSLCDKIYYMDQSIRYAFFIIPFNESGCVMQ